jgi:CHAT domain-containing protein
MPASIRWQVQWRQRGLALLLGLLLALGSTWLPRGLPASSAAPPQTPAATSATPAAILDQQARQAYSSGDAVRAAALWRLAAETYRTNGNALHQARMLSNLALALQQQGQYLEAQRTLNASLALLEAPGPASSEQQRTRAQLLHTQARLHFDRSQFLEALTTWRQAAALYRQLGAIKAEWAALLNQAEALQNLGHLPEARSLLESLLNQPELQAQPRLEATILDRLADTVHRQGDLALAQSLRQRSLAAAQASGDATANHQARLGLADALASQGATAAALEEYQRAASLATSPSLTPPAITNAPLPTLQAQASRLALLIDSDQYRSAGHLWPGLLAAVDALPANPASLELRLHLARTLLRLRQVGPALPSAITPPESSLRNLLQRCQTQAAQLGDRRSESLATGQLGELAETAGAWHNADTLTQQALRQAMAQQAPELTYRWLWQLGRIARHQGNRQAALDAYRQAIAELSSLRLDFTSASPAVASSFRRTVEPITRQYIDLLTDSPSPSPGDLDRARRAIEQLQVAELNDYFRQPCFQSTAIDGLTDSNAAVIYPILLPDRLEVIARLPGRHGALLHHTQPLPAGTLERTVADLDRQLQTPPDPSRRDEALGLLLPQAQWLHQWLLGPLEARLQASGVTRLVFVPDAALRNLPMAVLHDGQQFLGDRYAIALAPGMLLTPSLHQPGSQPRVLLAGLSQEVSQVANLPAGSNSFPALPAVEQELDILQRRTGAPVLLNNRFTRKALEQELKSGNYAVVHLATHGQFSSSPQNTFLLAGQRELIPVAQLPELLQPSQRRTGNSLDLLVLSACQGALGDADANLGLAAVAVRSGASSTLASLWSVNDQSTALFMDAFYKHWLQDGTGSQTIGKAEALRRAQADLRRSATYNHPYYWAAFTLLGNWS